MTEETGKVTNYVPEDRAGMTERGLKATLDKVASLGYAGIGVTGLVLLKGTLVAVLLIFAGRGLLYDGLALYKGESHQWRLERKDVRAYDIEVMKLKWENERTKAKEDHERAKDEAVKKVKELEKRTKLSPERKAGVIAAMEPIWASKNDSRIKDSNIKAMDVMGVNDWAHVAQIALEDYTKLEKQMPPKATLPNVYTYTRPDLTSGVHVGEKTPKAKAIPMPASAAEATATLQAGMISGWPVGKQQSYRECVQQGRGDNYCFHSHAKSTLWDTPAAPKTRSCWQNGLVCSQSGARRWGCYIPDASQGFVGRLPTC